MDQNQNSETQSNENAAAAAPAPKQEIIRGRMPVAVVALVRFGSPKDLATKAAAEALGTTVGKIDDIRKNRNFAYVTADFRPTEQQKADGKAWLERHPNGAPAALIAELEAIPTATAEEAQAFEATRAANRGQSATTKEGEPAPAGGGNRRGGKKNAKAEGGQAQATGDALLQ